MSLINDALKKAQRQRTNNPFGIEAPVPGGGGRVARRSSGMPTQTIMLIVAGCAVLVVLSGVGAVLFVNRKPASSATPTAKIAASSPASIAPTISTPTDFPTLTIAPIVPAKIEQAPVASAAPSPSPVVTEKQPDPIPAATPAKTTASDPNATPVQAAPISAATAAAAPTPVAMEEKINAYLDALRITGVRGAGAGSRVLLNEKVYKLNDIVDRNLGLKLTAVESDHLKFTAQNGLVYEKSF